MDTIYITAYSETHLLVTTNSDNIDNALADTFKFFVPGYRYMPSYKRGNWDGSIRLWNPATKTIYRGLLPRILKFAKEYGCTVDMADDTYVPNNYTMAEIEEFLDNLNLPITPYDYQMETVLHAVNQKRLTILSPTGSGKSLIIYLLSLVLGLKTLIIVPTRALVSQMEGDFYDYGYSGTIHLIYSGKDKDTKEKITITTWQSLLRVKKEWYKQFDCVFVDETHQAKAKSLTNILESMKNTEYRYGTTGTLDGEKTNRFIIEGLLGPVFRIVTTSQLMDDKVLAQLKVRCLKIIHTDDLNESAKNWRYQREVEYIIGSPVRNEFIVKLAVKLPGNNLVLFRYVKKHGDVLHKMLQEQTDRPIYYIHGEIDGGIRDDMRAEIEKETNAIILAGVQAFATGSNVKMLNNIIFTHPSKSRITTLQAIGRVLRRNEAKTTATLYDLTDDLKFSARHFEERLKIYKSEEFPFKIDEIKF